VRGKRKFTAERGSQWHVLSIETENLKAGPTAAVHAPHPKTATGIQIAVRSRADLAILYPANTSLALMSRVDPAGRSFTASTRLLKRSPILTEKLKFSMSLKTH